MPERIFGPDTFTYDPREPYALHIHAPVQPLAGGEMNEVFMINSTPQFVIKSPRPVPFRASAEDITAYEGITLALLNEAKAKPPVQVPRIFDCDNVARPPRNILSYVSGEILDTEAIQELSPMERQRLGHNLGAFVVWMANAISPEVQAQIAEEVGFAPFSRKDVLGLRLRYAKHLMQNGYYTMVETMYALYDTYDDIVPPDADVVGHNDLRAANLVFGKDTNNLYRLDGVFDFGITTTASVEHEMRHFVGMGDGVLEAAVAEYAEQTGIEPSREAIWHIHRAQVIAASSYYAIEGTIANHPEEIARMLKTFPEKDWSELGNLV
jgi:aminoglycoside phosphotransferase (APT) family kinase protein